MGHLRTDKIKLMPKPAAWFALTSVVSGLLLHQAQGDTLAELTLLRHQDQFRTCYETQLRAHPTLQGRVVVAFTISPEGRAADLTLKSTTLHNSKVENCILDVIRGITDFPPPDGGAKVQLTYPFKFTPKSRSNG